MPPTQRDQALGLTLSAAAAMGDPVDRADFARELVIAVYDAEKFHGAGGQGLDGRDSLARRRLGRLRGAAEACFDALAIAKINPAGLAGTLSRQADAMVDETAEVIAEVSTLHPVDAELYADIRHHLDAAQASIKLLTAG